MRAYVVDTFTQNKFRGNPFDGEPHDQGHWHGPGPWHP